MQWTNALTISNFLSIVRVMLIVPIFQSLSQNTPEGNAWALFYMTLAIISDFLDGFLARVLGQVSDLGKLLDPLADKICILSVTLILTLPIRENPLPLWFLAFLLFREITIITCGYLIYKRRQILVTSNIWGKSTSTAIALMLLSYIIELKPASIWLIWLNYNFLLWLSFSFIIVSAFSYGRRFYKLLTENGQTLSSGLINTKNVSGRTNQEHNIGDS